MMNLTADSSLTVPRLSHRSRRGRSGELTLASEAWYLREQDHDAELLAFTPSTNDALNGLLRDLVLNDAVILRARDAMAGHQPGVMALQHREPTHKNWFSASVQHQHRPDSRTGRRLTNVDVVFSLADHLDVCYDRQLASDTSPAVHSQAFWMLRSTSTPWLQSDTLRRTCTRHEPRATGSSPS